MCLKHSFEALSTGTENMFEALMSIFALHLNIDLFMWKCNTILIHMQCFCIAPIISINNNNVFTPFPHFYCLSVVLLT